MPAVHRELAPAKLTRQLHIVGRRADGFHLLEAEMVSLDYGDELEIGDGDGLDVRDEIPWSEPNPGAALEVTTGNGRGGLTPLFTVPMGADNLVAKALRLAGRRAKVRLVKRIPPGAGLGGGSSDAAAVLRWAGALDPVAASHLGADVPFCLQGGRGRVTGIGERIEPLPFVEESYVVASPDFGVSSALAYRAYDEVGANAGGENDLELAAMTVEPRLQRWRDIVREATGATPLLAGSGSSWFVPCASNDSVRLAGQLRLALTSAGERAAVTPCKAVGRSC